MIASFYDNNFRKLQNNALLTVDKETYRLIKRPVEFNELTCMCEAFTEDIQPTFVVVADASGDYVYGCLAGVPLLNKDNQTEINGTDLKKMLDSDIIVNTDDIDNNETGSVSYAIQFLFDNWLTQVNQNSFTCELEFVNVTKQETDFKLTDYKSGKYNALEEIQKFLRFYNLYIDTRIDVVNEKIKFIIGNTMQNPLNVKLWEFGIKNYGKIVAGINEAQGYYAPDENDPTNWTAGYKWILTSDNKITTDTTKRDIYPIIRKIETSSESLYDANRLALERLLDAEYNEDIDLQADTLKPNLSTRFDVYTREGGVKYKELPCGELQYDANNELVRFKIGYRYTTVNYI